MLNLYELLCHASKPDPFSFGLFASAGLLFCQVPTVGEGILTTAVCVKYKCWSRLDREYLCVLMCMCLDHKRPHGTPESMVSEYRIWDSSFLQVFFLLPILSTGGGGVPLFPLYTEHNSCSDFNVIYGPFYTIFSVVVQNHFLKLKD